MFDITKIRTMPYHVMANGMVERMHRTLKQALMCHNNLSLTDTLHIALLRIRTAVKEDIQARAPKWFMEHHCAFLASSSIHH
ncbi:hypothetical protein AVEN_211384-1 [Araneus ventricosus]|uniref:Integrase catalytic domain-containing protein n=1 Tax=Araneus ventricosus TaxID=182803 RepID=A0A4Y2MRY9_ARAVE|nr:hypothetical protein AVEN_211384-1 [Araneus ventricosus]